MKKQHVPDIVAAAAILAGFLGLIIYSAYTRTPGPFYAINQFLGVWLTALVMFFALQTWYLNRSAHIEKPSLALSEQLLSGFALLECVILFLGYCAGSRVDGVLWSMVLIGINILNLYILIGRKRSFLKQDDLVLAFLPSKDTSKPAHYRLWKFLVVFNAVCKVIAVIFLALLINGAWTLGAGYHKYTPRGKFVSLTYADGNTQKIHYLCEGPTDSQHPTFWFEVGGGHNMCDFYGIHLGLVANNRRSCIYDRPGLGWSEYWLPNQPYWYYDMIKATGEKGPFIIAAWGGGGEIVYPFVRDHPEMVHSLVFMDVSEPNIEWNQQQYLNNWTDTQRETYKEQQLALRFGLFDIIRGMACPWGLMSLFVPYNPTNYEPKDRYDEFRWHQLIEKHWTTQFFMLVDIVSKPSPLEDLSDFPSSVNPVVISSHRDKQTICDNYTPKLAIESAECERAYQGEEYWVRSKTKLFNDLNKNNNGTFVVCEGCDLGFPVKKSQWTVETLMQLFANTTV